MNGQQTRHVMRHFERRRHCPLLFGMILLIVSGCTISQARVAQEYVDRHPIRKLLVVFRLCEAPAFSARCQVIDLKDPEFKTPSLFRNTAHRLGDMHFSEVTILTAPPAELLNVVDSFDASGGSFYEAGITKPVHLDLPSDTVAEVLRAQNADAVLLISMRYFRPTVGARVARTAAQFIVTAGHAGDGPASLRIEARSILIDRTGFPIWHDAAKNYRVIEGIDFTYDDLLERLFHWLPDAGHS